MSKVEIYEDKKKQWRWRLRGRNGKILASGEGYASKRNVIKAVETVNCELNEAIDDERVEEVEK